MVLVKIDFTKIQILIVDDNASVRKILQALLSFSGAPEADEAADGDTALQMLAQRSYDAVILDCNLGGRSGLDIARQLRGTSGRNQQTPILMVTARQDLATVQEAKTSGIDDYLIKPVTAGALATRLYSALVKRRQAGGPAGARAALRRA